MAEKTPYHILKQVPNTEPNAPQSQIWAVVAENVEALSADQARRIYAETVKTELATQSVVLVAVPARSWNPEPVGAELTIKFGS